MSWLKTGQEFPLDAAASGLSDAAYRTHHEALTWVMFREAGPSITHRDVVRFAESPDYEAAAKELVAVGWWRETDSGYLIVHSMEHQPTPKVIRKRRLDAAKRQAKWRETRGEKGDDVPAE